MGLDSKIDLSANPVWLAEKYNAILSAAIRAIHQLSRAQLDEPVPWHGWKLKELLVRIISIPELAWLSHEQGSMTREDMQASDERLRDIGTIEDIVGYGEDIRVTITEFLESRDTAAFQRVVQAHHGGELTVIELLNLALRTSAYRLKQTYWFMENNLDITLPDPATEEDMQGIPTPAVLS